MTEDLAAYTPVANAVEHYRWGLALRTDDALDFIDGDPGAVVPLSFWTDGVAPHGRALSPRSRPTLSQSSCWPASPTCPDGLNRT